MSKDDRRRYLILKDPNIYKGLLILSLPVMLNNFLRTVHDFVDMFFVSKIAGHSSDAISSISVTFPVFFTFISLGMGLGIAGTALISQLVGSDQRQEARKYATNLFLIALILGVLLNVLAYIGAPTIIKTMGVTGYTLEKATAYLRIRSFELVSLFVFYAFTSIRQSDGDTMTPVIFGVITLVLNTALSPIFVTVLGFGVEGAAYATLIGNTVIMPFILYQIFYSKTGLTISFKESFVGRLVQKDIIKLALPASTGQSITAIGFYVMNTVIVSYGIQTVAAFSVGNRISSIILHPVMAIGGVLAAYIGQNVGNADPERARESFKKAMVLAIGIMSILSFGLMFFREPLAGIFLADDPVAFDLSVKYLFYLLIGLPLMGIFTVFIGAFNGTGKTKYTFIVSVTRLWLLRIPLIIFFRNFTDLGSGGVWTAMLISNFIIAFVSFFFYLKVDYKPRISLDI